MNGNKQYNKHITYKLYHEAKGGHFKCLHYTGQVPMMTYVMFLFC